MWDWFKEKRRHDLKDVEGGLAAKVVDNPSVDLQAINLYSV